MGTFSDRTQAAQALADRLEQRDVHADVVLAIPRGGLPLGRVLADRLGLPLDVIIAKKIGAPGNPELAIGAATPDGSAWINQDVIRNLGLSDEMIDQARQAAVQAAADKAKRYRPAGPELALEGKRVIVVDDGVATGATTRTALQAARARGASHTILAVPVGPPDRIAELGKDADEVVCLETPAGFFAVGQYYERFEQVTDEEAIELLEGAR